MSLFGDLYVGTSGLQGSQEALNVVAHNVTNTDTEGYVRQQVSYGTREYNRVSMDSNGVSMKQTGLGVYITEVRQVRDRFIDASYREEVGRSGFYDASNDAIEEIEEIFGELDGANFYESLNGMWNAIEELVKDPSSEVTQSMFVQLSKSFCEAANNVYKDLSDYQDKLNVNVKNDVDRINQLGQGIYKLNEAIRAIEAGGIENANDLKDQRNQYIDELSKLAKISYDTDYFGNILVQIEGHDFVLRDKVNEIAYQADEDEFYAVFWPDSAKFVIDPDGKKLYYPETAPVFDFSVAISSATDTDLGELKSVLLARGDHRGNWTDLGPNVADCTKITDEDRKVYSEVKDSIMMNVMAEFDGLVRNTVIAINSVLEAHADPANNYLVDDNGNPMQLFHRIACYDTTTPENPDDSSTWFSADNITINQDLLQYPTKLGFVKPDDSVDYEVARELEDAFNVKKYMLNPDLTNPISITEYYSNLIGQIGNSGNVYKQLKSNQDLTVESIESKRQGLIGVSTDEELTNMIKYQNAYNASSRFINVIDECMEHLINTLAR